METLAKQLEIITDQAIQVIHDFVKATNGSYVNAVKEDIFDDDGQGLYDSFISSNIELFVDTMWNDNQLVYILKITGDDHTPILHYITEHGTEDSQDILELNKKERNKLSQDFHYENKDEVNARRARHARNSRNKGGG